MAELDTLALPVLPLSAGVVLPQTVVTLTLDSDEAKAAVAAANGADGRVLLVPRIDGRYAQVGTVAQGRGVGRAAQRRARRDPARPAPGHARRRACPAPGPACGSRPTRSIDGPPVGADRGARP